MTMVGSRAGAASTETTTGVRLVARTTERDGRGRDDDRRPIDDRSTRRDAREGGLSLELERATAGGGSRASRSPAAVAASIHHSIHRGIHRVDRPDARWMRIRCASAMTTTTTTRDGGMKEKRRRRDENEPYARVRHHHRRRRRHHRRRRRRHHHRATFIPLQKLQKKNELWGGGARIDQS